MATDNPIPVPTNNEPTTPIKVDLLGAYLKTGIPFNQMFQSIKPTDEVYMRPFTDYLKDNPKADPHELENMWNVANEIHDEYHRGKLYAKYQGIENVAQLWGEQFKPEAPDFKVGTKTTPGITGKVVPLFTPQQEASASNKVRDYNADGSYTEKEMNWYDRSIGAVLNPLLVDYEKDAKGESVPYLRHEKPGEYAVGMEQLSVWGPQELYGKSVLEAIPGFLSAMTVEMGAAIANIAGAADYGLNKATNLDHWGQKMTDKDLEYHASLFSNIANVLNSLSYKPSVESQNESWFDSAGGFSYKLGQGIGMLMPQKWGAKLAMGAIKLGVEDLTKYAVKTGVAKEGVALTKQELSQAAFDYATSKGQSIIGREGEKYIISRGSAKAAMTYAAGVGSIQALSDVYTTAIQNGVNKTDAVLLTMTASPFIYATERLISAKWVSGLLGEGGYADFKTNLKKVITSSLEKDAAAATSDGGRIAMMKNVFGKVGGGMGDFLKLIKDAPISRGMVREGMQESSEEALYMAMEKAYDSNAIPWTKGPDKDATVGHGKYGTEMFDQAGRKRLWENALGGAILGGVFDSFTGNAQTKSQDDYFNNEIINGRYDELKKNHKRAFLNGMMGYEHKDWKNETIYKGAEEESPTVMDDSLSDYGMPKGYKIRTLNDMNAYNLARNIEMKKAFLDSTKITDPALLKRYIDDKDIVQEGLNDVNSIRTISEQLATAQEELKTATDSGNDIAINEATPKIQKLEQDLARAKEDYVYHVGQSSQTDPYSKFYYDKYTTALYNRSNDLTYTVDPNFTPKDVRTRADELNEIQKKRMEAHALVQQQNQAQTEIGNKINQDWKFDPDNAEASLADLNTKLDEINQTVSRNQMQTSDVGTVAGTKLTSLRDEINNSKHLTGGSEDLQFKDATNKPLLASIDNVVSQLDKMITPAEGTTQRSNSAVYDEKADHNASMDALMQDLEKKVNAKHAQIENVSGTADIEEVKNLSEQAIKVQQLLNLNKAMNETEARYKTQQYIQPTEDVAGGKIGNDLPETVKTEAQKKLVDIHKKLLALNIALDANKQLRALREFNRRKHMLRHKFNMLEEIFSTFKDDLKSVNRDDLDQVREDILTGNFSREKNDELIGVEKIINRVETEVYKKIGNDVKTKKKLIDALHEKINGMWTADGKNKGVDEDTENVYTNVDELAYLSQDELLGMADEEIFKAIHDGIDPKKPKNADGSYNMLSRAQRSALVAFIIKRNTNYINTILDSATDNFTMRLKEITEPSSMDDKDHIPSVQQQNVLRNLFSFLFSTNPFIARVRVRYRENEKTNRIIPRTADRFDANIFVVPADGGFGKTSVIARNIFKFINSHYKKSPAKARVKVYSISRGNHLNIVNSVGKLEYIDQDLLKTAASHDDLINDIAEKKAIAEKKKIENFKGYDYVIVDEASRLTAREMIYLTNALKGTNTKVILLGDPKQAVNTKENFLKDKAAVPMQQFGITSPYGSEKFRTGIFDIQALIDAVNKTITGLKPGKIDFPFTRFSRGANPVSDNKGVMQLNSTSDVRNTFEEDIKKNPSLDMVIVFATNQEADEYAKKFVNDPFYNSIVSKIRFISESDNYTPTSKNLPTVSIQSEEHTFSYVSIEPGTTNYERKNFGTAISRAKQFVVIASGDAKFSAEVNNDDIKDAGETATAEEKAAQAEQVKQDKARINTLAEGLGMVEANTQAQPQQQPNAEQKPEPTQTEEPEQEPEKTKSTPKTQQPVAHGTRVKHGRSYMGGFKTQEYTFTINGREITGTFIHFQGFKVYDAAINSWVVENNAVVSINGQEQYFDKNQFLATAKEPTNVDPINTDQVVDSDPALVDENNDLAGLKFNAREFDKDGSMATSMGISEAEGTEAPIPAKEFFVRERLAKRIGILLNKNDCNFRLKFYRNRTIMARLGDGTYGPKVLNNLLVVEAVNKKDDSVHVMSVMYEPMLNADTKIKAPYTTQANHDVMDPDVTKLNALSNEQRLYFQEGYAGSEKTGEFVLPYKVNIKGFTGSRVEYNLNSAPRSLSEFVGDMTAKGLSFLSRSGSPTTDMKDVYIEMEIKPNNGVDYFARVSYDNVNWVKVEVKAPHINGNTNMSDVMDSIAGVRKIANSGDPDIFSSYNSALNESEAYQFLLTNKRLLLNNGKIATRFAPLLELKQGKIFLKGLPNVEDSELFNAELDNLEKAVKELKKMASPSVKVYGWVKIGKTVNDTFQVTDPSKMMTIAEDVHFPMLSVNIDKARQQNNTSNNPFASLGWNLEKDEVNRPEFVNPLQERMYLELVLGSDFVNNPERFGLEPSLESKDGKALYGVVRNAKMLFESVEGRGVLKGVAKHEAVHYILTHMVSPNSFNKIISATRWAMKQQGYKGNISIKAAEEFLAEVNRGIATLKSVKEDLGSGSFLKKVMSWFKGLYNQIRSHGDMAEQFLADLNDGVYRDQKPAYNFNLDYESTLEKNADPVINKKKGPIRVSKMVERFGTVETYERAKRNLAQSLLRFGNYNRTLNDTRDPSASIKQDIDTAFREFVRISNAMNLNEKFGSRSRENVTYSESYGAGSDQDAFILWKLSDRQNFDSVLAEVLPTLNYDAETVETIVKYQYGDSQSFDVRKTISSALRLHLGAMPLYSWTKVNGSWVRGVQHGTVRYSMIEKALINAVFQARATQETFTTGEDLMNQVYKNLQEEANRISAPDVVNETADTINSFLDVFSRNYVTSEYETDSQMNSRYGATVSHSHLAYNYKDIIRKIFGATTEQGLREAMDSNLGQSIYAKHKASSGLMNALYSHFMSMQRQDLSYTEVKKRKGNTIVTVKKAVNSTADRIKNDYKAAVNYLTPAGAYVKSYKDAFNGRNGYKLHLENSTEKQKFGHVYYNGTEVLRSETNRDGTGFRYVFANDNITTEQVRHMLLTVFHMQVPENVIRTIFGDYQQRAVSGEIKNPMTKAELSNMLGHMFLTIAGYDNEWARERTDAYLGNRSKDQWVDETDLENEDEAFDQDEQPFFNAMGEINDQEEPEESERDKAKRVAEKAEQDKFLKAPKLSHFDMEFSRIAQIQEVLYSKTTKGFTYGATGTKYYTTVLGHYLSNLFGQSFGLKTASDVVTSKVHSILSAAKDLSMTAIASRNKHNELIYNDPLMRFRNKMKIERMSYTTGIRNKYNGKDVNSLNKHDYLNTTINGHFANSVFSRNAFQTLDFAVENFSDSSVFPIFSVTFDNTDAANRLVKVHMDGNGNVIGITDNEGMINDVMSPIFDYHLKAAQVSVSRWTGLDVRMDIKNFGKSAPIFRFSEEENKGLLKIHATEGPGAYLEAKLDMLAKKVEHYAATLSAEQMKDFVKKLRQGGMLENRDYILKKGKLTVGNTTRMNHDIFNAKNVMRFKNAYDDNITRGRGNEKEVSDILDGMFYKRFKAFTDELKENHVEHDRRLTKLGEKGTKYFRRRTQNGVEVKRGQQQMFDWNPFYRAYYYGQHAVSTSVSNLAIGPENQFSDSRSKSKKNKNGISMGWNMMTGSIRTVGHTSNIVKITDSSQVWNDLKNLFGVKEKVIDTDGHILISPLEAAFVVESTGGNDSMISYDDSVLKRVSYGVDYLNDRGSYIKSSELKLNGDLIDNSRNGIYILRHMLTGANPEGTFTDTDGKEKNLFTKYMEYRQDGMSHHDAIMELKEFIIKDRIATGRDLLTWTIGGYHMESTHKIDDGYTNDFNPFDENEYIQGNQHNLMLTTMDNDNTILQLNPYHEHDKVSKITQQEVGIGVMDSEAGLKIDHANTALATKNLERLNKAIAGNKNGLVGFLREISIDAAERMTQATNIIQLVSNVLIDITHPVLRDKAIMELKSQFNRGIQTKRTGQKLIQQHDKLIEVVQGIDSEGNVVVKMLSEIPFAERDAAITRNLRHTHFYGENGQNIGELMQAELDQLKAEGKDIESEEVLKPLRQKYRDMIKRVIPGEVIIPADTLKEFINSPFVQNKTNGKSNPSLNDMLTINIKGLNINVRSFLKETCADYYNSKEDGLRALEQKLKTDQKNISAARRMEILNFYRAFIPKLEVYFSRIPATMPSAGSVGEVIGLTYDSKGIIYTSPVKNLLDGSDYDVDTLTMYMRSHKYADAHKDQVDEKGKPLPQHMQFEIDPYSEHDLNKSTEDGINNYIFDTIFKTYINPDNLEYTTKSLSIQDMKDKVQEQKDKTTSYSYDPNDNAENFIQSHEGKNMVSRFANAIGTYSRLMHIPANLRTSIIKFPLVRRVFRSTVTANQETQQRTYLVIETLAKVLQASVDNAKELIIGYLNINRTSGNIVTALVLSDMTMDDIYKFLEDPSVVSTIKEAANSESAENMRVQLMDIIDRKIKTYEALLDPENLEARKKEYIYRHTEAAKYYTELANKIDPTIKEGSKEDYGGTKVNAASKSGESMSRAEMDFYLGFDDESDTEAEQEARNKSLKDWYLYKARKHNEALAGQEEGFKKMLQRMQQSQAQMALMREMAMKGEAIRRITKIFSLASGHDGTDYDTYRQIEDIEFITGRTIEDILSGMKGPADGWKRSIQFKSDKAPNKGNYQVKEQVQLDTDMGGVFDNIFSRLNVPAGVNVSFVTNGSDGMAQSLANKALKIGPLTINMPKGRMFKNKYGQTIYSNSEEALERNILNRYPGLKAENVNVTDAEKIKDVSTKNASGSAITILAYSSKGSLSDEMKEVIKAANGKIIAIDMNTLNLQDSNDPQVEAAQKALKQLMDNAVVNNYQDIQINLAGNTLFDLMLQRESERQRFERRENEVRRMVDYTELIRSLPNIKEYLNQLNQFNTMTAKVFYQNSPFFKGLLRNLFGMQMFDKAPSSEQYFKAMEGMTSFIADRYFSLLKEQDAAITLESWDQFGKVRMPMTFDLRNKADRDLFTQVFPTYVIDLKNSNIDNINSNGFIKALGMIDQNLGMTDNLSFTPNDIVYYNNEFVKLEKANPELAHLLHMYNLMRYKFEYRKGSMTQMMGMRFMEEISSTISEFNKELTGDGDNEFKNWLAEDGVSNILIHYPELWRNFDMQKFDEDKVYPKVAVSSKKKYRQGMIRTSALTDPKQKYERAYDKSSNKDKSLSSKQSVVSIETADGKGAVVNLVGQDLVDFHSDGVALKNFTHKHEYNNGQVVYVDGVLAKLETVHGNPRQIRITRIDDNPVASKPISMKAKMMNAKGFDVIMGRLKTLFPNMVIRTVDNTTTRYPGLRAYFEDGVVHYNTDLVTYDTPIHELAHPILEVLRSSNDPLAHEIYHAIMGLATSEINMNTDLYKAVKAKYPDLNAEDFQLEMAATILGFRSVNQVMKYVSRNQDNLFKKVGSYVREAYDWFMGNVLKAFGYTNTGHYFNRIGKLASPNATFGKIVDQFIADLVGGEVKTDLSQMQTSMLRNMKVWNSRNLDAPLTSTAEFANDLLTDATSPDVMEMKNEELVNKIYNTVLTAKDNEYTVFGKTFSFPDAENKSDETRSRIRSEVLPVYDEMKTDRDIRIQNWLNSENDTQGHGRTDDKTIKKMFEYGKDGRRMFDRNALKKIKAMMGYHVGDKVILYSELANEFPALAEAYDATLAGNDPWIIVHRNAVDSKGNDVLDISLFDISYMPLGFHATQTTGNHNILANYINDSKAKSLGITLMNTLKGVRKMELGVVAMKIAERNPNVNIRRVGVMTSYGNDVQTSLTDMTELAHNLFAMSNVKEFMDRVPSSMKSLLEKETLKEKDWNPDWMMQLNNMMTEQSEYLKTVGKESEILGAQIDMLQEYIANENHSISEKKSLMTMLRSRQRFLETREEYPLDTVEKKAADNEYRFISKVLNDLVGFDRDPLRKNKGKRTSRFNYMLETLSNVQNEIEQNLYGHMKDILSRINGVFIRDYKEGLKEAYEKINQAYFKNGNSLLMKAKGIAIDESEERCKNMWMWSNDDPATEIYDAETGQKINVNLRRIHWDKNNPITARKLAQGKISIEEVQAGAVIAQRVEDDVKALLCHELQKSGMFWSMNKETGMGELNTEDLEKAVDAKYNSNWQKGMMPVMSKSLSSMFFEGKVGATIKMKSYQVTHPEALFDDILTMNDEDAASDGIRSFFYNQFINSADSRFGGTARMTLMGLTMQDGRVVYRDTNKTKALMKNKEGKVEKKDAMAPSMLSDNLEHILDNFGMDTQRKINLEQDFMPAVEDARIALKAMMLVNGVDPSMSEKRIQTITDRIAHNEMQHFDDGKAGRIGENILNFMQRITSFTGVAFSLPTAETSLIGNWMQAITHAVANKIGADAFKTFSPGHLAKAAGFMVRNINLCESIMGAYQVSDRTMYDVVNNPRFKMLKNNITNERAPGWMNWLTDYEIRMQVTIAQLMYDGSLEAFSLDDKGRLQYDQTKDKRFYTDGKQTAAQAELLKWLKEELADDPRYAQEMDKPAVTGYSNREQRRFKWIGDQFAVGAYSQDEYSAGMSHVGQKLLSQFRMFGYTLAESRLGQHKFVTEGGKPVVVENEDGTLVRQWWTPEREGAYRTFGRKMLEVCKNRSLKDFQNMSDIEKHNLIKTCQDIVVTCAGALLGWGLWDDKKKQKKGDDDAAGKKKTNTSSDRLVRAFQNGVMSVISVNPMEAIGLATSIPIVNTTKSILNIMLMRASNQDIRQITPGKATYDSVVDLFPSEQDNSKQ